MSAMEENSSLFDSFIVGLFLQYWWALVIGIVTFFGGRAWNFFSHKKDFRDMDTRLTAIENLLKQLPHISPVLEPYMVIHGICERGGQNRQQLETLDVRENACELHMGPTTAERLIWYFELPPGRVVRKVEQIIGLSDVTDHWRRLPGTYVWFYYGPSPEPDMEFDARLTTELVQ